MYVHICYEFLLHWKQRYKKIEEKTTKKDWQEDGKKRSMREQWIEWKDEEW